MKDIPSSEPPGRQMTTAQIRSFPEWPKLEAMLKGAMEQAAIAFGVNPSDVELVDEVYYWIVKVGGEPIAEIDPRDLSEHSKN